MGVGLLPHWLIPGEQARGELLPVLTDWELAAVPLHVVCPSVTFKSKRVEALVEFLIARLRKRPGFLPPA